MLNKIFSRLDYVHKTCLEIFGLHDKPVVTSEYVEELLEKGFVILPSLSQNDINQLLKCKDRHFLNETNNSNGQSTGRVFSNGLICDEILPLLSKPFDIVCNVYGGQEPNIELTYFQESYPKENVGDIPGGQPHLDDSKSNFKFFVYLSDVYIDNGPFCAKMYSHGWNSISKKIRGILWSITTFRFFLYKYYPSVSFINTFTPLTGQSGFAFLVDTTGWHMAMPVKSGFRSVFVASFNRK